MPAMRFKVFQGVAPRVHPELLQDSAAQDCQNVRLTRGTLDTIYYPAKVAGAVIANGAISIFNMSDQGVADTWLSWSVDVDVSKGMLSGDTTNRVAFTSDSFEPRVTNRELSTSGTPYPAAWYVLGVTPPVLQPSVSVVGGSGSSETRAYVTTFVTQWGEESAPSPASAVTTGYINGTWTVSNFNDAPANSFTVTGATWSGGVATFTVASTFGTRVGERITVTGVAQTGYNVSNAKITALTSTTMSIEIVTDPGTYTTGGTIMRDAPHNTTNMVRRVYRSVTTATDADYYFIKEVPVSTTSVIDDVGSGIGEPLPTSGWIMPPADMQGIMTLPSGVMVGFSNNEVCVSEPGIMYAWPQAYRLTSDYKIVGLGQFAGTLVVLTEGPHYFVSGYDPSGMTMIRAGEAWPCVSKRGIANTGSGVAWPTYIGLAYVGVDGMRLLTKQHYDQQTWSNLNPSSFVATFAYNMYYATYSVGDYKAVFVFDPTGETGASYATGRYDELYTNPVDGLLYVVDSGAVSKWDADYTLRMPTTWRSKEFKLPVPINLGAAKVDADFGMTAEELQYQNTAIAAQIVANEAEITGGTSGGSFNAVGTNTYSFNGSSIVPSEMVGISNLRKYRFELLVKGEVVYSRTQSDNFPFRLPAGFKYDRFSVRIVSTVPVSGIVLGETMDALRTA